MKKGKFKKNVIFNNAEILAFYTFHYLRKKIKLAVYENNQIRRELILADPKKLFLEGRIIGRFWRFFNQTTKNFYPLRYRSR